MDFDATDQEVTMDFDAIAEQQGWDTHTILEICRDYISLHDHDGSDLTQFAQDIADQENG